MKTKTLELRQRAYWLGYLGLLPILAGGTLISLRIDTPLVINGLHHYAALILTFVGAIHWGLALYSDNRQAMTLSVVPSLLAWCSLFLLPAWGLPLLVAGFLGQYVVDTRQAGLPRWFRRLRLQLTFFICALLSLSWLMM
ncbi:DUF3429 domain-containing protein [Sedimenticola sp.]|uniref:DUF3429 domain-containing protein n=1 Tax=Sedimenticola sp. TaxID=1940285 RepID=UPI00258B241D|nr:DUF3429 domain-containing protein [Sedimenticola sp.]MCW8902338.1 DUF3429 domain-containing protein [Sedimenticola sp.]